MMDGDTEEGGDVASLFVICTSSDADYAGSWFEVVDTTKTTKEDRSHGDLEAQRSALHPRETPV
jgi:hypothetical protein